MKRSSAPSLRLKVNSSRPRKEDLFSTSSTSQLELLHYLGLEKLISMKIQKRECVVSIEGSKCKICKKLFKCTTDTKKHMKKKHKYLKRKKDNKRVRVVFKFGEEKFCDNDINRKYLISSVSKSAKMEESHKMKKFDQKPLEFLPISVHKEVPMIIDNDLLAKISISVIDALKDIKTQDEKISNSNSRINKSEDTNSSSSAHNVDLGKEVRLLIPNTFEACHGRSSPASITSDAETIILISDNDMTLEELYEDINPDISKVKEEDDSDDGEIVILNEICRNGFKSTRRRIQQTVSANFDIEDIRQIGSKAKLEPKLEPMESEPITQVSNPHVPMVRVPIMEVNIAQVSSAHVPTIQEPIAEVPIAQVLNPDIMGVDYSDVSDAETVIWDTQSVNEDIATFLQDIEDDDTQEALQLQAKKDTAALLRILEDDDTQNAFELQERENENTLNAFELLAEETYNLTVEEQKPAHTTQEEDSDIIMIQDEEPNKEVGPIVEIEPVVEDKHIVEDEAHLQSSKLIEVLKNIVFLHEKKTDVDRQTMLINRNNNESPSTGGSDLFKYTEGLRSLLSGNQQDCERLLQILEGVQRELKASIGLA